MVRARESRTLSRLSETPARAQQELDLQIAMGPALMVTKPYSACIFAAVQIVPFLRYSVCCQ